MVDALFDAFLQCKRLAGPKDNDNNLSCFKDCLDAHSQSHSWHPAYIVVKEARVGKNGVVCQCLDSGTTGKA